MRAAHGATREKAKRPNTWALVCPNSPKSPRAASAKAGDTAACKLVRFHGARGLKPPGAEPLAKHGKARLPPPAYNSVMAGLDPRTPIPTEIKLHQSSRLLELTFADGKSFRLPYEFLRVYSPSADVRGHGPGQETLQVGKRDVTITDIEAVGHYAIRPKFSDGHDTGIYSWDYLLELGERHEPMWQQYLDRMRAAGASREPDTNPAPPVATAHSCGHRH